MITTAEFGETVEFKHTSTVNHSLNTEKAVIRAALESIPKGGVFYDVGACMGLYSIIIKANRPDVTVYAFEPHPENYKKLNENVELNGLDINTVAMGMSNWEGLATVGGGRGPGSHKIEDQGHEQDVPVVTYSDWLLAGGEPADVMKIDVEGSEQYVLEGINDNHDAPSELFVEVHLEDSGQVDNEEENTNAVNEWFTKRDYTTVVIGERSGVKHYQAYR